MISKFIRTTVLTGCLACLPATAQSISDSATISQPPAKSELVAYGWALGGTLIPFVSGLIIVQPNKGSGANTTANILLGTGLILGPSLGQYYAGSYWRGSFGIVPRVAGSFIFSFGLLVDGLSDDKGAVGAVRSGAPGGDLILLGGSLMIAGTVYSLIDTHFAVKRANEKVKAQHFGFSPELFPSSNGGLKPGVMAWARF